jgi:hypothetical protein
LVAKAIGAWPVGILAHHVHQDLTETPIFRSLPANYASQATAQYYLSKIHLSKWRAHQSYGPPWTIKQAASNLYFRTFPFSRHTTALCGIVFL